MLKKEHWDWEIYPTTSWLGVSVKELFSYKDLLIRLVRKEFLSTYQQTLLGPFWVLLRPLLTVLTYVLVFNKVIGVSTQGIPSFLYYLVGITLWNLFSELFLAIAKTYSTNIGVLRKVHFPAEKPTFLKILSKMTKPTIRSIKGNMKVNILLEIGTGFHYKLTGRENIYISVDSLFRKKREVSSKVDEIESLSGVEPFLDTSRIETITTTNGGVIYVQGFH